MNDVRHWVLVVQNDSVVRDGLLVPGLEEAGFNVVGVGSAMDAYRCMLSRNFPLFVLDGGLTDADGLPMAGRLRTVTDAGIVVLVERRRGKGGQKPGPDDGADAFVAKPVDVDALASTLRSLMRRSKPAAVRGASVRATHWRIGAAGWDLISPGGAKVQLNQPERLLIGRLAASSGETVARDALIALLAGDAGNFGDHRLEMLVHRLRRKALAACGEALPLKAIRGVGYVLSL